LQRDCSGAFERAEQYVSHLLEREFWERSINFDALSFRDLDRVPQIPKKLAEIVTHFSVANTLVSDLSEVASLSDLRNLDVNNSRVTDLSPISGLSRLTTLNFCDCDVEDISALERLEALQRLYFSGSKVSSLLPLSNLNSLQRLFANHTPISGLEPLRGKQWLNQLHIDGCENVTDLSPIVDLPAFKGTGVFPGIEFKGTGASARNPELLEISLLRNDVERTRRVLDFVKNESATPPEPHENREPELEPPPQKVGPIQVEFRGDVLVRIDGHPPELANLDQERRAREGWSALKEVHQDIAESLSSTNVSGLNRAIDAFGRALGDRYEDVNTISLGTHGRRIVRFSEVAGDLLLEDSAAELQEYGLTISIFLNRFKDWLDYVKDSETDPIDASMIDSALPDLQSLVIDLNKQVWVTDEIANDLEALSDLALIGSSDSISSYGFLTAIENILSSIGGKVIDLARSSGQSLKEFGSAVSGDLRKKAVSWTAGTILAGTGGLVGFLGLKSAALVNLAEKVPALKWVQTLLDGLGIK